MQTPYNPKDIEKKWQDYWKERETFLVKEDTQKKLNKALKRNLEQQAPALAAKQPVANEENTGNVENIEAPE